MVALTLWEIRPLPSNKHSVGVCMYWCGLGGLLGCRAPWGVCSWEGLLFREHPLPPSCSVCCVYRETELGKPRYQRGQFGIRSWDSAVLVNTVAWMEESWDCCQCSKSKSENCNWGKCLVTWNSLIVKWWNYIHGWVHIKHFLLFTSSSYGPH